MKQNFWFAAVLGTAAAAAMPAAFAADEMARVISRTAIMEQVGVPRQACATYATPGVAPSCSTQTIYESRVTGYKVVYELGGKRYSVQLPQDPGPTLRVQGTRGEPVVTPAPMPVAAIAAAPAGRPVPAGRDIASVVPEAAYDPIADAPPYPPDYVAPQSYAPPVQVTYAYPGYVAYYDGPAYWGPTLGIGLVGGYYVGRHYGRGHWHGRRR